MIADITAQSFCYTWTTQDHMLVKLYRHNSSYVFETFLDSKFPNSLAFIKHITPPLNEFH